MGENTSAYLRAGITLILIDDINLLTIPAYFLPIIPIFFECTLCCRSWNLKCAYFPSSDVVVNLRMDKIIGSETGDPFFSLLVPCGNQSLKWLTGT